MVSFERAVVVVDDLGQQLLIVGLWIEKQCRASEGSLSLLAPSDGATKKGTPNQHCSHNPDQGAQ